jgi:hypothetical protein
MTEPEWFACETAGPLNFLGRKPGDRKLRLFAYACCWRLFHPLQKQQHREAVAAAEQYADGQLTEAELVRVREEWERIDHQWLFGREACEVQASRGALSQFAAAGAQEASEAVAAAGVSLGGLLRCIVSNPFRRLPAIDPSWLSWQTGIIPRLARAFYDERRFQELPILADALEEAGCTDTALLAHCRELDSVAPVVLSYGVGDVFGGHCVDVTLDDQWRVAGVTLVG